MSGCKSEVCVCVCICGRSQLLPWWYGDRPGTKRWCLSCTALQPLSNKIACNCAREKIKMNKGLCGGKRQVKDCTWGFMSTLFGSKVFDFGFRAHHRKYTHTHTHTPHANTHAHMHTHTHVHRIQVVRAYHSMCSHECIPGNKPPQF